MHGLRSTGSVRDSDESCQFRIVAFNRKTLAITGETTSNPVTWRVLRHSVQQLHGQARVCRFDNDLVFPLDSVPGFPTLTGHADRYREVTASSGNSRPFGGSSVEAHYSRGREAG